MIRKLLTVAAVLTFALFSADRADAQALKVIKHRVFDKKFLVATAVSVGLSIAATRSLVRCRADHGIGPCTDGGYGPFTQREVLRQGMTGFLILPSYETKRIEDRDDAKHKFWWLFPAFNAAWNSGVIVQNARKRYGPKDKD
jgi:hypothetical protein